MAMENLLPLQHRSPSKIPLITLNRLWRSKERLLIGLVCLGLVVGCFGTVFFLPELRASVEMPTINRMYHKVYEHVKKVGPELILLQPPLAKDDIHEPGKVQQFHGQIDKPAIHLLEDQARLKAKIEQEEQSKLEKNQQRVIPKPFLPKEQVSDFSTSTKKLSPELEEPKHIPDEAVKGHVPVVQGGEDPDPDIQEKRNKIKEMMKHAWDSYAKYAWGKNELRPVSLRGHSDSIFGSHHFGATIVDGMDTLFIMGLMDEFNKGKEWVTSNLNLTGLNIELSVFETNIRFVGGLLACYGLTGDVMFRDKANHVASLLLPAFNTPTGIPNAIVNINNGFSKNYAWASSGSSILSELGTLSLEFNYMADVSGNRVFRDKIEKINQVLLKLERTDGLYPNYLNPKTGRWGQQHVSMGALGDSFYEYLLKAWLQSGKTDEASRLAYVDAMEAAIQKLIHTSKEGLTYFAEMKFGRLEHKMDHLACFSGGMLALGGHHLDEPYKKRHFQLGRDLTYTCHESYDRTKTKLGPEAFRFSSGIEAKALKSAEKYYILRPEVIESYFVLWRLTHDPRYRQWGWEAAQALEKHCRTNSGFSGIKNVYSNEPTKDDVQQSFFLAETLKYLYLLFSDDSLISLDHWVFNSEAHPLPIKGVNSFYRAH